MNLRFYLFCLLLVAALPAFAVDTLTNSGTKLVITNGSGTNKLDAPPTKLESVFTNSADMLLVQVSAGMWAGKYEVTQKEYLKIMGSNPSAFRSPTRPVDSVSWSDAMSFCSRMTEEDTKEKTIPEGFYYTLPTEDEWENLAGDAKLEDSVTSSDGPREGTSPVGTKNANSLGLCDVRGNVMEFCLGDDSKPYRVLRGGSWSDSIEINLRPIFRFYTPPDARQNTFGFRVVLKKH